MVETWVELFSLFGGDVNENIMFGLGRGYMTYKIVERAIEPSYLLCSGRNGQ